MEHGEIEDEMFEQDPVPLVGAPGAGNGGIGGGGDGLMGVLDRDGTLFDSEGRIIIARNADLDPHEITKITRTKDPTVLSRNLYCFLCCLSLETSEQEGQMNIQDVYIKLTTIFMESLGSVLLDQFYNDTIFHDPIFKDGHRKCWPACFTDYVEEKKSSGKVLKTATFKKNNPGLDRLPADMQPLYLWGKNIKAVADTAKTTINNRLNKVFVPPSKLMNGETPSAVMDAIRKSMRPSEALQKATVYWNGLFQRKKKLGAHLGLNKHDIIVTKHQEILASMTNDWFPDCWLSFSMLSLPSGDKCLTCFKTTDAAALTQSYVAVVDDNRGTRRRLNHSPISEITSNSSAEIKTFVLQVQMPTCKKARTVSNEDKITEWSLMLQHLSKVIDCLEKRAGNEVYIARLESQIRELAVLVTNATDSMISEASHSVPNEYIQYSTLN